MPCCWPADRAARLYALTSHVAKPAVPFGGKYRIIDFPLSNCVNSGIDTVGVLTQYQPLELNCLYRQRPALGPGPFRRRCACSAPLCGEGRRGHLVSRVRPTPSIRISTSLSEYDPEYVLILSGDHIYKMDYAQMLAHHKAQKADRHHLRAGGAPWRRPPASAS